MRPPSPPFLTQATNHITAVPPPHSFGLTHVGPYEYTSRKLMELSCEEKQIKKYDRVLIVSLKFDAVVNFTN